MSGRHQGTEGPVGRYGRFPVVHAQHTALALSPTGVPAKSLFCPGSAGARFFKFPLDRRTVACVRFKVRNWSHLDPWRKGAAMKDIRTAVSVGARARAGLVQTLPSGNGFLKRLAIPTQHGAQTTMGRVYG
jgi:hypothetical protein